MSTKPGIRYMPGRRRCRDRPCGRAPPWRSGTPGVPALRMRAMRLPSTTMSIGPCGGAPVPSMSMTPRMTSVLNGPSPSPCRRAGAAMNPPPPRAGLRRRAALPALRGRRRLTLRLNRRPRIADADGPRAGAKRRKDEQETAERHLEEPPGAMIRSVKSRGAKKLRGSEEPSRLGRRRAFEPLSRSSIRLA